MMDAVIIQDQRELKPSFITPTQRGRDRLRCACFMSALLVLLPCKSVEAGRERRKKKKEKFVWQISWMWTHPHQPSARPAAPAGPAFERGWCNNSYFWQDYIISPSVSVHEVVPWCSFCARQVNTEVQLLGASQFTVYFRMTRRRV